MMRLHFHIRTAWLISSIALAVAVLPVLAYDETHPSQLCSSYGFLNPFTGNCFGSFLQNSITFEHEGIGIGFIIAGLLMRKNVWMMRGFIIAGFIFVLTEWNTSLALLLQGAPVGTPGNDYINNPVGETVSAALGFLAAFSIYETTQPRETLGVTEIEA